jgi:O-methyltransferase
MLFNRNTIRLKEKLEASQLRVDELKRERDGLRDRISTLENETWKALLPEGVPFDELSYNADGLSVWGKNLEFMETPEFKSAYHKGINSGHKFLKNPEDLHIEWRVHVVLWAAQLGLRLQGDFVECGVNTGIFSLAIAEYHQFAKTGRTFYLFDTFCGTPEEQMSDDEREKRINDNRIYYPDCFDRAKENFSPYPNMRLVRGKVPEVLSECVISKVSYLSIDMNVASAEVAALEYFWERLERGAPVVLDDYAWSGCETQKRSLDKFASRVGASILTLPTGQGLLIKS